MRQSTPHGHAPTVPNLHAPARSTNEYKTLHAAAHCPPRPANSSMRGCPAIVAWSFFVRHPPAVSLKPAWRHAFMSVSSTLRGVCRFHVPDRPERSFAVCTNQSTITRSSPSWSFGSSFTSASQTPLGVPDDADSDFHVA